MLGTLSLCGVTAAACSYHTYRQTYGPTIHKNPSIQVREFRSTYGIPQPVLPITTQLRDIVADRIPLPKEKVVSFDLFDTLVGRDVPNPDAIFSLVEAKSGIVGFAEARKLAGEMFCSKECLGDISEVYKHISKNTRIMSQQGIDLDRLREMEWEAELEHAVLIASNVNKLLEVPADTGIIIVSDTFYDSTKLRELLLHVNLPRIEEITVFATRSGKEDGWIWPILNEVYTITSHTGDNRSSDVASPLGSKVIASAIHSKMAHMPTAAEELLLGMNKDPNSPERTLAYMIRRLSLGNPYSFEKDREKFFWYRLHASYTIPCFWYFIQSIKTVLESNPQITRVAAISRDCILLEPLLERFLLLERGVTLVRLDSSRRVLVEQLKNPNQDYLDYLREVLGEDMTQTLVIDINGTYRSLSDLTKKYFDGIPKAHFLSIQNGRVLPKLKGILTVAVPEIDTNVLEKMNVTRCGSLVDWVGTRKEPFGGPVRTPCEYSEDVIEVSHRMILQDSIPVLVKYGSMTLPRSRVIASLMEQASVRMSGVLHHTNTQVTLPSLIQRSKSLESQLKLEVAKVLSRIISQYHNSSVRLLDTSGLGIPWKDFMKNRVELTDRDPELVLSRSTRSEIGNLLEKHKCLVLMFMRDYLPTDYYARFVVNWELLDSWSLCVFREDPSTVPMIRKAEPAHIDVDDLPEVPTHAFMVA